MQSTGPCSPLVPHMRKRGLKTSRRNAGLGNVRAVSRPAFAKLPAPPLPIGPQSSNRNDGDRYFELYSFAPVALLWLDRYGVVEEINQQGCVILAAREGIVVG